jgi:hypothetical protein
VIAQGVGDDRCWHLYNVRADGGCAAGVGEAELVEEVGEAFGVHGLSCPAVGEQPLGVRG